MVDSRLTKSGLSTNQAFLPVWVRGYSQTPGLTKTRSEVEDGVYVCHGHGHGMVGQRRLQTHVIYATLKTPEYSRAATGSFVISVFLYEGCCFVMLIHIHECKSQLKVCYKQIHKNLNEKPLLFPFSTFPGTNFTLHFTPSMTPHLVSSCTANEPKPHRFNTLPYLTLKKLRGR